VQALVAAQDYKAAMQSFAEMELYVGTFLRVLHSVPCICIPGTPRIPSYTLTCIFCLSPPTPTYPLTGGGGVSYGAQYRHQR